jgi:hypothetical protein
VSFNSSLNAGKVGETLYFLANNGKLEQLNGRAADFRDFVTGDLYEVKTDFYNFDKTPNFFIEKWSDAEKKKTGGPYRAQENGCKFFVYIFASHLKVFTFETDKLVERLNEIESTLGVSEVPNTGWLTKGFRVNRELLKDLYVESELEVKLKEKK